MFLNNDPVEWWKAHAGDLKNWVKASRLVILVQPSSAAAERVFSILSQSFLLRKKVEKREGVCVLLFIHWCIIYYYYCDFLTVCVSTIILAKILGGLQPLQLSPSYTPDMGHQLHSLHTVQNLSFTVSCFNCQCFQ